MDTPLGQSLGNACGASIFGTMKGEVMIGLGRGFLAVCVLAACASLTEEECLNGDWRSIGLNDGVQGMTSSRLQDHAKACSEVGIVPDQRAWESGRRDGLVQYCTPSSAYQVGRSGRSISNVCSARQYEGMQSAFFHGQQYYDLGREIDDLELQIDEARAEIIAELKANNGAVNTAVFFLEAEIADLNFRIRRLERERRVYAVWP